MSHGKDKQAQANDLRVNQAIQEVKTPSALEQWQTAQAKKWMDYSDGTGEYAGKPRDITQAPNFSDVVDVYGSSKTATDNDRHGGGGLNLVSPAAGAYADQQKQLNNFNFYNNRAEGISNAVANMKAQNLGQADALIGLDTARKNNVAGLELQNQQNYYNRPQKPSIWQQLLSAVGNAEKAGETLATGGFSSAGAAGSAHISPTSYHS